MEQKEEIIFNALDTHSSQGHTESQSTTIHALMAKGRLSLGFSNHKSRKGRKVINLKQQLPVLGRKLVHNQTHRMYESVIMDSDEKEPTLRRVKLSQIINLSHSNQSIKKKPTRMHPVQPIINAHMSDGGVKKRKKEGYAKQKIRLVQNKNRLTQFLSNYGRVDLNSKLKDVLVGLKQQVIRANSCKFGLLSKVTE